MSEILEAYFLIGRVTFKPNIEKVEIMYSIILVVEKKHFINCLENNRVMCRDPVITLLKSKKKMISKSSI